MNKQEWEEYNIKKYGSLEEAKKARSKYGKMGGRPARLTDKDVEAIRASDKTNGELATKYKVHKLYISQIRNGRRR